ncbi:MAG: J domain-containing protein [Methylococcaceae bacterium]
MKTNKSGNANLKVLATATLIRRFHEKCAPGEIYDKAIRCYETLIESIEKKETAEEISALLDIPADKIRGYAEAIINSLLFNKEQDPYLSLGLNKDAPLSAVSRRWKSLIVLYHPDKHLNQNIAEEKAKKINERYEEIQKLKKDELYNNSFNNGSRICPPGGMRTTNPVYFKYLPLFIIGIAMIIAILSILLLIFDKILANSFTSPRGAIEVVFQNIRISSFMGEITYQDINSLQTVIKGLFHYAK